MGKGGNTSNAKGANAGQSEQAKVNQAKALALRIRGKSYRAIADEMGVSVSTAHKYVDVALDEVADVAEERAEKLRELEVRRLDEAIEQVRKVIDGEEVNDDTRMRAVDRLVKLSESRRKLLGLDAPERRDLTSGGQPLKGVIGIDPDEV